MKEIFLKLSITLTLLINISYAHINSDDCCPLESCERGSFTIGGDWLYWKTQETKLEYGASIEQTFDGLKEDRDSKILKPKFQYDSGLRIFADYSTCDTLWKFSAIYSYMPSDASDYFTATSPSGNFASLLNVNFNFPILNLISTTQYLYSSMNSKWNSTVNYFDFDASRKFQICSNLELLPHAGIRALWSNQTLHLNGTASDVSITNPKDLSFTSKLSNNISAFGLEGGLNICWKICRNFSLIGNVGGSLLYANIHTSGQLDILYDDGTSLTPHYRDRDQYGIPMFDAFIGFEYKGCLCRVDYNIHLGWEEHTIFNTNTLSINGSGNYTLQGLTLGAALSF